MGRRATAWVAPSPSTNRRSTRSMAGSNFTGIPVSLNLCLHTCSIAANSAKSAQKFGAVPEAGMIPQVTSG